MTFRVVIPARLASTRLPGKLLLSIGNKSVLEHAYDRAMASGAESVVIAADDAQIQEHVESFGGQVVMTASHHKTGTDRIAEAVTKLGYTENDVIVNVQGDEPFIAPENITQVADNLIQHKEADMATLCEKITSPQEVFEPNIVKVVKDELGRAMYFSRAPIPWHNKTCHNAENLLAKISYYRHIGIYCFRVKFICQFVSWPRSALEEVESLEQLRALSQGAHIHVATACKPTLPGIDTLEDLQRSQAHYEALMGVEV